MTLKISETINYFYLAIAGMEYQVKKSDVTFGSIKGPEIDVSKSFLLNMPDIEPPRITLIKRTFNVSIENVRESDFERLVQERVLQKNQSTTFPDVYFGGFKVDQARLVACIPVGEIKPSIDGFYPKVLLKFESQLFL